MPTVYASGSPNSDGYLSGVSVPTSASLLANIRDILTTAGWTVDQSQIAGGRLEAVGEDNGDNCWLIFLLTNVAANEYNLSIRGDINGTGVTLSPDEVKLTYLEGSQARLYLTADSGSGCIFIQNGPAGGKSAHFGFLERLTDSPYSLMVARLTVWEEYSYMARDIWNVDWAEMNRYFRDTETASYLTGAKQHLWDSYTIAMMPYTDYNSSANNNPAYFPYLGAVDSVTGLPILSDYGYLIGRDNTTDYINNSGKAKPTPLHFPGRIKFARTGLASVDAGDQFIVNTQTVISGGAIGDYQGFVIKDSAA